MNIFRMHRDELEPALIRHFPFLSRRRTAALEKFDEALRRDSDNVLNMRINTIKHTPFGNLIVSYSSRTLEMMMNKYAIDDHDQPSGWGYDGIMYFARSDFHIRGDEMTTRAVLDYWGAVAAGMPDCDLYSRHFWRDRDSTALVPAFTAARSCSPYFMDDVTKLTGEKRQQFAAIVTLFVSTIEDGQLTGLGLIPRALTDLVMNRPDRIQDILQYQRERGINIFDMQADAVAEYLDSPAPALSIGML